MSSILESVHVETAYLGAHYQQVLSKAFTTLYERKLLMTAVIATALALGVVLLLEMPKKYTAEASIRGGFSPPNAIATGKERNGGREPVAFDASLVVETRSRLFQSYQLARRVVEDLGLELLGPAVSQGRISSWLQAQIFGADAVNSPEYQKDIAAAKLLHGLSVKTEPRVYLISISYTAADPELAALITNTFIAEFLRTSALQTLSGQRGEAQASLAEQLATLGDKHPKVNEARMRLATADRLFEAELSANAEDILKGAGENVAFAQANVVPSSPKPFFFIGFALLAGLLVSGGLAMWLGPRGRVPSYRGA